MKLHCAALSSLGEARRLIQAMKRGECRYDFVEVMACPGGCIGGGGNPPKTWSIMEKRKKAIYEAEAELPVRQSHKNPAIQKIYETYLGEPCGELSHKLLHTEYCNRQDLLQ